MNSNSFLQAHSKYNEMKDFLSLFRTKHFAQNAPTEKQHFQMENFNLNHIFQQEYDYV